MYVFDYSVIQVQSIMLTNLFMLIILAYSDSFNSRHSKRMALTTELFMAIISYHLIVFTNFVPDKDT